tara:strand:- start:4050 stop:4232 length:183 start_codon:yes stop_codon:yes gene_type:complete
MILSDSFIENPQGFYVNGICIPENWEIQIRLLMKQERVFIAVVGHSYQLKALSCKFFGTI